jgi:type VI protein secretion system component VasK
VGLVAAWLLIAFGREVADAAAASDHAAALRQQNAQLAAQLAAIQVDMARTGDDAYVNVAARGDGLGARHEVPFALAPDAPSLAPDAPGSASQRLGAIPTPASPLDAWLARLFGSG